MGFQTEGGVPRILIWTCPFWGLFWHFPEFLRDFPEFLRDFPPFVLLLSRPISNKHPQGRSRKGLQHNQRPGPGPFPKKVGNPPGLEPPPRFTFSQGSEWRLLLSLRCESDPHCGSSLRYLGCGDNQKYTSDPRPRIKYEQKSGQNMTPSASKQGKFGSWGGHIFCSYLCLVCGGWGCKKNPQYHKSLANGNSRDFGALRCPGDW